MDATAQTAFWMAVPLVPERENGLMMLQSFSSVEYDGEELVDKGLDARADGW